MIVIQIIGYWFAASLVVAVASSLFASASKRNTRRVVECIKNQYPID